MNVILDEDKELLHPIGLGRNPTIVFTPHQIEHMKLKLNTKVTTGCVSGLIVGAGLEVRPCNHMVKSPNQIYCKLQLSDYSNEIWVLLDDLMFY
jgi:hypothetical protein